MFSHSVCISGFASTSQVTGRGDHLLNDLYCVKWNAKAHYTYTSVVLYHIHYSSVEQAT